MKAYYYYGTESGVSVTLDREAVELLQEATEKKIQEAAQGKKWAALQELMETHESLSLALKWFSENPAPEAAEK